MVTRTRYLWFYLALMGAALMGFVVALPVAIIIWATVDRKLITEFTNCDLLDVENYH